MSTETTLPRPARSRRTRLGLAALALAIAGTTAVTASPGAQAAPGQGTRAVAAASAKVTTDFGYLTWVERYRGVDYLTLDRAIMLEGEASRRERVKRGLDPETPDFYIVNDNPLLRTLPLHPDVEVVGSIALAGQPESERVTLQDLKTFLAGDTEIQWHIPFHLERDSRGRITKITEQYLP